MPYYIVDIYCNKYNDDHDNNNNNNNNGDVSDSAGIKAYTNQAVILLQWYAFSRCNTMPC